MRIVYSITGIIAFIMLIVAVIARLFLPNKVFLGLSALSYLRVTNTMLLFTLVALVFEHFQKGKKE